MPKKMPAYLLHKPTGQARVRIDGKDHYLGPYGSPASRERYDDLIAEWFAKNGDVSRYTLSVDDLCLLFLQFADEYYRRPDGTPTGTVSNVREVLRYLVRDHGTTRVRDFGPRKLKEVRQALIDDGRCRTNINRLVHWIRRVFRWGVENEYVPVETYTALATVASLKAGRTKAVESEPVKPVDEATINATLPHLPSVVADMVRLQLLSSARPGEIIALRPCDLTIADGVWTYRPETHKTQHRGKERRIYFGPNAQAILRPYLDRDPEAYCFSTRESSLQCNGSRQLSKARPPRHRYDKNTYCRAIIRACERAFDMPTELRRISSKATPAKRKRLKAEASAWRAKNCWSPNQLRHTRATLIRERYGIEAAQVVLGHSDPRVTEIYAERDFGLAAKIMGEIG